VRERLEREKGRSGPQSGIDIKFSAGGMLDVYFVTRYLQLRDDIADEGDDRSTSSTLGRLEATGSLDHRDYEALSEGYGLLRSLDHYLRLVMGKVAVLPSTEHPAFKEIARNLNFKTAKDLSNTLIERMQAIRQAYDRITAE
jgi:glutamine synthetase adenylyltransferase